MNRRPTSRSQTNSLLLRPAGVGSAELPHATLWSSRPTLGQVLRLIQYVLGGATLCFWAWWLANGWGRDLLHRWRAAPIEAAPVVTLLPATSATVAPALGGSLPVSAPASEIAPNVVRTDPTVSTPGVDRRPTRLSISAIALDSPVREVFLQNDVWQVADYAVGYHHGTGEPGVGNVVLAGHKGIRGAVFARLESLRVGDDVWLEAPHGRFRYQVSATSKVWPDQVGVMQPTDEPIVTMITCTNWDTKRFVAVATLVEVVPTLTPSDTTAARRTYKDEER